MRYAVLADVHANLEALSAVLDAASAAGAERVICAGDIVGYHADPDACVERLRAASAVCVAGNHDRVAAGIAAPDDFGPAARRAALWTRARLSPASRAFLAGLPLARVVDGRFLLVHGALHPTPNAELHLSSDARVTRSIQALRDGPWGVRLAFFGHTHRAVVHSSEGRRRRSQEGPMAELSITVGSARYLVNPGSVGQPRDGDPRAAFALVDVGGSGELASPNPSCRGVSGGSPRTDDCGAATIRFCRVPFDAEACLAKVVRAGLSGGGRLGNLWAGLRRVP